MKVRIIVDTLVDEFNNGVIDVVEPVTITTLATWRDDVGKALDMALRRSEAALEVE